MRELLLRRFPLSVKRFFGFLSKIFFSEACSCLTRVEELLREQLLELGEDPASLAPHLIMQNMQCEVYPDESMVYIWKDIPILRVAPERTDTGVMWRMFTRDEGEPLQ